jgi:hypothetical protein
MGGGTGKNLNLKLHVWRQKGPNVEGQFVTYEAPGISTEMSFLEMLDVVNERLAARRARGHRRSTTTAARASAARAAS